MMSNLGFRLKIEYWDKTFLWNKHGYSSFEVHFVADSFINVQRKHISSTKIMIVKDHSFMSSFLLN